MKCGQGGQSTLWLAIYIAGFDPRSMANRVCFYQQQQRRLSMRETVNCPFCAEEILAVARKCKHCGEWLDAQDTGTVSETDDHKVFGKPKEKWWIERHPWFTLFGLVMLLMCFGGKETKTKSDHTETMRQQTPDAVEKFTKIIENAEGDHYIRRGTVGDMPTQAHIFVSNAWMSAPYDQRLESVRLMHNEWRMIIGDEVARTRIFDPSGMYIGGGSRNGVSLKY